MAVEERGASTAGSSWAVLSPKDWAEESEKDALYEADDDEEEGEALKGGKDEDEVEAGWEEGDREVSLRQ